MFDARQANMNNPNNNSTSQKKHELEKFKKDMKQMIGSLMDDQGKFHDFKQQMSKQKAVMTQNPNTSMLRENNIADVNNGYQSFRETQIANHLQKINQKSL